MLSHLQKEQSHTGFEPASPTLSSSIPTSGLLVDLSTICAGVLPVKLMGHNENLKELWSNHRVIYVWSSKIFVVF